MPAPAFARYTRLNRTSVEAARESFAADARFEPLLSALAGSAGRLSAALGRFAVFVFTRMLREYLRPAFTRVRAELEILR